MMNDQLSLPLTPTSMVWHYVYWPRPLPEAAAIGLLRHWSAQHHRSKLVLEARADVRGVRYLVGTQRRSALAVQRAIEQLVPGSLVTAADSGSRVPVTTVRRLKLTSTDWPLEAADRITAERSILSALSAVAEDEELVIQMELGRGHHPTVPEAEQSRGNQSVLSKVLLGIQAEDRPGAKQANIRKLSQHGFATTLGAAAGVGDNRDGWPKGQPERMSQCPSRIRKSS
ncbi:hypothetical protein FNL39_1191, partial [Nocardia caishijiensis]